MTTQFFARTNEIVALVGADHRDLDRSVRDLGPYPVPPVVQSHYRGYVGTLASNTATSSCSATFDYADGDTYVWQVMKAEVSITCSGLKSGKGSNDISIDYPETLHFNPHYTGDRESGPANSSTDAAAFWEGAVELPACSGIVWNSSSNVPMPAVGHIGLPGDGHDLGATYAPVPGWRDTHFALATGTPCVAWTFDNDPFDAVTEVKVYANILSYGWPAAWRKASSLRIHLM